MDEEQKPLEEIVGVFANCEIFNPTQKVHIYILIVMVKLKRYQILKKTYLISME